MFAVLFHYLKITFSSHSENSESQSCWTKALFGYLAATVVGDWRSDIVASHQSKVPL